MLQQGVQGITDLINVPGLINLDFADVQTVMKDKGIAHIGIGTGSGDDKCVEAVKEAISSPLLETTIEGASHVIINISGDVGLQEANDAAMYIEELTGENTNIIFGVMFPEAEDDSVKITVIATGLEDDGMHLTEEHTPAFLKKPAAPKTNFPTKEGQLASSRPVAPSALGSSHTAKTSDTFLQPSGRGLESRFRNFYSVSVKDIKTRENKDLGRLELFVQILFRL